MISADHVLGIGRSKYLGNDFMKKWRVTFFMFSLAVCRPSLQFLAFIRRVKCLWDSRIVYLFIKTTPFQKAPRSVRWHWLHFRYLYYTKYQPNNTALYFVHRYNLIRYVLIILSWKIFTSIMFTIFGFAYQKFCLCKEIILSHVMNEFNKKKKILNRD